MLTTPPGRPVIDLVGAILAKKYRLVRLVGAGGMGAVYESQSPEDGRRVAVKVLAQDYLEDPDVKARFVDEGQVCQRLVHPNIVRVFDVGTAEDGSPFIVMELLEGVPLSVYTRAGVRVPVPQAVSIMQGILAGLGAAHAQGIVHRDLKPENVYLARGSTGTFAAKLLDFGIAKVMDVAGNMGHTKTGVLLGTPAYMSPEQIRNAKDVDARSDLWSAGVMFYEMLTGRFAFPAPNEYARLAAVLHNTPVPIEKVESQLAWLSAFVSLSMQRERSRRFQTAPEMARALTGAMALEPAASSSAPTVAATGLATAMSRLPDVPSTTLTVVGGAAQEGRMSVPSPSSVTVANFASSDVDAHDNIGPGGTLASRPDRSGIDDGIISAAPIMSAAPPAPASQVVPPWQRPLVVTVLAAIALVIGFVLGFAAGRR
ncbi:MAG: protein kinase [Polyangiaceae bacterium]|nr:protein kinase [Polyangiaceae bacterium]